MTERLTPYEEGFRARLAGDELPDNPYPSNSHEGRQWDDGWHDQDEHLRDRDEALRSIGWF